MKTLIAVAALSLFAGSVFGQHHGGHDKAPYAGQQAREVTSLSPNDLEELRRGGGWGLAKPAELNGLPGPLHLLELKDEVALTPEQVEAIEAVFSTMRQRAVETGRALIAGEKALDEAFRGGAMDESTLRQLLTEVEKSRAALRFIHLSAHLATAPLLTPDQIERYNVLRGYADDPCAKVPEGHNAEMWRRHNGCG